MVPEGFFVIHQPKQKIPSIFDLHERGKYKERPYVTENEAYRVIAREDLSVKLQFLCLKEKAVSDPMTGVRYSFCVEETLIDLDEELRPQGAYVRTPGVNPSVSDDILTDYDEWRVAYIPLIESSKIDKESLKKKLLASIAERKEIIRKELVRKNSAWVNAEMPRLIQDFMRGLYLRVDDRLYDQYMQMGGKATEKELIKSIMLFQRIYDHDQRDLMRKPEGGTWKSEDELWECWTGFAGSEEEAKKVCLTMEAVFRPLIKEVAQQKAIN